MNIEEFEENEEEMLIRDVENVREMEMKKMKYIEMSSDPERFIIELKRYGEEELMSHMVFSTGGMRGLMRSGFNGINEVTCNLLGTELSKRYRSVVIGCDARYHSLNYAILMKEIFEYHGCEVHLHSEVVTPFLAFLVSQMNMEVGVMITASHNPRNYNGFKVYTSEGSQIGSPLDKEIEESMRMLDMTRIESARYEERMRGIREENDLLENSESRTRIMRGDDVRRNELIRIYNESMFSRWGDDVIGKISSVRISIPIVFTGLCGVSGDFVRAALDFYNLRDAVRFIEEECTPDSRFPDLPFPNPEVDGTFDKARMSGIADVIFSCDPDGDRFGLSERIDGKWISYNGNEIAAMLMYFFIENFTPSTLVFINTFLCDDLMEIVSSTHGIEYLRTETGFKNVSRAVSTAGDKNVLAYEDSLGFLFGSGREKDGIKCVVLMTYLVQNMRPSDILKEMRRYGNVNSVTRHVRSDDPQGLLSMALDRIPDVQVEGKRYVIEFDDYKVILRVSGTESILKVYVSSKVLDKSTLNAVTDEFIYSYITQDSYIK